MGNSHNEHISVRKGSQRPMEDTYLEARNILGLGFEEIQQLQGHLGRNKNGNSLDIVD